MENNSKLIAILTEMIAEKQDNHSRKTGFGYGFDRWILSIDIAKRLNMPFKQVRDEYKKLVDKKLIESKQNRSHGLVEFSTCGWEDCTAINDYFIEYINPNSFQEQGRQPY